MSLDVSYRTLANPKIVFQNNDPEQPFNSTFETLSFYFMALGMRELTSGTVLEYMVRMRVYDAMFGTLSLTAGDPAKGIPNQEHHFTYEELKPFFGLSSNVTQEPRTTWLNRMAKHFAGDKEIIVRGEIAA
jgi:hypothetical protein